jgi:hypothetical protein
VKDEAGNLRAEVERIRRVSDMLCTGHAGLRDHYARRALTLDLAILALSTWLVALAFVRPRINLSLTPFALEPTLWIGLLAVMTFLLSVVQMKVDWKGLSDAHKRSCALYANVHREAGYVLAAAGDNVDEQASRHLIECFDLAGIVGIGIPERQFLPQKRRHQMKIAISKYLDTHPAASIFLTRIRFWFRDNFSRHNGDERQS